MRETLNRWVNQGIIETKNARAFFSRQNRISRDSFKKDLPTEERVKSYYDARMLFAAGSFATKIVEVPLILMGYLTGGVYSRVERSSSRSQVLSGSLTGRQT